jgi:hypothetical protein
MAREDGMTYEELILELKNMKRQIRHHHELTKEMHRLDAEYWYINHMEKRGLLSPIEIANAYSSNS